MLKALVLSYIKTLAIKAKAPRREEALGGREVAQGHQKLLRLAKSYLIFIDWRRRPRSSLTPIS